MITLYLNLFLLTKLRPLLLLMLLSVFSLKIVIVNAVVTVPILLI